MLPPLTLHSYFLGLLSYEDVNIENKSSKTEMESWSIFWPSSLSFSLILVLVLSEIDWFKVELQFVEK